MHYTILAVIHVYSPLANKSGLESNSHQILDPGLENVCVASNNISSNTTNNDTNSNTSNEHIYHNNDNYDYKHYY